MTKTVAPILAFAVVVLLAGVLHGLHTDRWGPSPGLEAAVRRLDDFPSSLGDWQGEPETFDPQELARGGIKGFAAYRYRNVITGDRVSLLLVCGRPGPISVHTPEVCYGGAGFEAVGGAARKEVKVDETRTLPMWTMRFKAPPSAPAAQIEVSWVWQGGNGWAAPDNPRFEFARSRVLYKLYIVRDVPTKASEANQDPSAAFVRRFLPVLESAVSPPS